jgi:hypothetical protein
MPCLGYVPVSLQMYLLIFAAVPEPLDDHIVAEAPAPVLANGNTAIAQYIEEVITGELATLIGVEALGPAFTQDSSNESTQKRELSMFERRQAGT